MHDGDLIMLQRDLVADDGHQLKAGLVGQVQEIDGALRVVVKFKGQNTVVSSFQPSDFVELW